MPDPPNHFKQYPLLKKFSMTTSFFDEAPAAHWRAVPLPTVPVRPFLAAATHLARLFDRMGSISLLPVKNDWTKNITMLEQALAKHPASETLQQVLDAERAAGRVTGECAITSYRWLVRGMELIAATFTRWTDFPSEELSVCFTKAYAVTLYKHHTWWQYAAFQLALRGIPTRAYFMARMGHPSEASMLEYFSALHQVLSLLPTV